MTDPIKTLKEIEYDRMKAALTNIEEMVKPPIKGFPNEYHELPPSDIALIHFLCCIARGGTIADGGILPSNEST